VHAAEIAMTANVPAPRLKHVEAYVCQPSPTPLTVIRRFACNIDGIRAGSKSRNVNSPAG